MNEVDYLVIGGGIIGLAIGNALLEANSDAKVVILEKESLLGSHASGRNSGVLHAGFYYSPNSLKARFCKEGNKALRKICKENGIRVIETGKVVVSTSQDEDSQVEKLFRRSEINAIELEMHEASQISRFEPQARTYGRFLWSPTTAVSDPIEITKVLAASFVQKKGKIHLQEEAKLSIKDGEVFLLNSNLQGKHVINCAGVFANELACSIGINTNYLLIPFLGTYSKTTNKMLGLRTLVYPVPNPINPFLGTHLTLTLDNKVKIGPSAIPMFGKEQYKLYQGFNFKDMLTTTKGLIRFSQSNVHNLVDILRSEIPKLHTKALKRNASKLVPQVLYLKKWEKLNPGIRAQLLDLTTGDLEMDFKVITCGNSTHILNCVSPGWTSAIPFARYIVESIQKLEKN